MIDWEGFEAPPVETFQAGSGWIIGNIAVQSFTIPHDAIDPVGFAFYAEGVKIGVATDLGYVPDSIKHHLRRIQILLIESNHDLDMLKVGHALNPTVQADPAFAESRTRPSTIAW